MASTKELIALFQAIGAGDSDATQAAAQAIARNERKRGHHTMADALMGSLVAKSEHDSSWSETNTMVSPGLLIKEADGPALDDINLKAGARNTINEIISEWINRDKLAEFGLRRRSRVLFWGPPGCGKTYTARAIGTALGLPVLTVRLSSVIGSYLGQTGMHLRQVFQYAHNHQCVLLLDEFDALARVRGRNEDVGEIDRVVISLLQEFDHSTPAGYLVGATNRRDALDPAVWRRFDVQLEFPEPNKKDIEQFWRKKLRQLRITSHSKIVGNLLSAKNFAEAEQRITDLHRAAILRKLGAKREQ